MIERQYEVTPGGSQVLLSDSVSFVSEADHGAIVVCASHGGESAGQYAASRMPGLIFFNDAGVGKENAGIRALELLEHIGVAAATVSNDSARIGDAVDHWQHGEVSYVNDYGYGIEPGMRVADAIDAWAVARAAAAATEG